MAILASRTVGFPTVCALAAGLLTTVAIKANVVQQRSVRLNI
jgi:hypothetical protein